MQKKVLIINPEEGQIQRLDALQGYLAAHIRDRFLAFQQERNHVRIICDELYINPLISIVTRYGYWASEIQEYHYVNVSDGTASAWCMHCGMQRFVGLEPEAWTHENEETFIYNVLQRFICTPGGGTLMDASTMDPHPTQCTDCHEPIERTTPPDTSRYWNRSYPRMKGVE